MVELIRPTVGQEIDTLDEDGNLGRSHVVHIEPSRATPGGWDGFIEVSVQPNSTPRYRARVNEDGVAEIEGLSVGDGPGDLGPLNEASGPAGAAGAAEPRSTPKITGMGDEGVRTGLDDRAEGSGDFAPGAVDDAGGEPPERPASDSRDKVSGFAGTPLEDEE